MKITQSKIYQSKLKGCESLVNLKHRKILREDIENISKSVGLKPEQLQLAWENFTQSGGKYVDFRVRRMGSVHMPILNTTYKSRKNSNFTTKATSKLAKQIIYEYLTTDKSLVEICDNYKIYYQAAYGWIKELTVSGTICGEKIIETKKYAKLPIIDVIWLYKYPHSKRNTLQNLSQPEKVAYTRVADVLVRYL